MAQDQAAWTVTRIASKAPVRFKSKGLTTSGDESGSRCNSCLGHWFVFLAWQRGCAPGSAMGREFLRQGDVMTIGDLLTGPKRPLVAVVHNTNGSESILRSRQLHEFMRKYASIEVADQGETCDQRHYTAVGDVFAMAVIATEA